MKPCEWDASAFKDAYARYVKFFRWMEVSVRGNPDFMAMLKRYTKDDDEREELRVMYEVVQIQRRNGFKTDSVTAVRVSADGGVDVDVASS